MMMFVLVVHLLLALALIGVILLQRSEGGALGIGGSNASLFSTRGQANLLTRTTAILATCFLGTSIILALLAGGYSKPRSILDQPSPTAPAQPARPAVPLSQ